jgi:hypothetical protein
VIAVGVITGKVTPVVDAEHLSRYGARVIDLPEILPQMKESARVPSRILVNSDHFADGVDASGASITLG